MASGNGEGWGHLNALLTEAVRTKGVTGKGAQRLLGQRGRDEGYADLGPEAENRKQAAEADVVVCASVTSRWCISRTSRDPAASSRWWPTTRA